MDINVNELSTNQQAMRKYWSECEVTYEVGTAKRVSCKSALRYSRVRYRTIPLLGLVAQRLASGVTQAHLWTLQEKKLLQNIRRY